MPRAVNWRPEEKAALAKAYVRATHNGEKGTDQTGQEFAMDILSYFEKLAPDTARAQGSYHFRGCGPVYNHWRDHIAKDVQAFNKAKRMVRLSNPTGVTTEEKHAMAVAIHLKKVAKMDYGSRNFDVSTWPNYLAYQVLMDVPKFSDANSVDNDVETDEEDEEIEYSHENNNNNNNSDSDNEIHIDSTNDEENDSGSSRGGRAHVVTNSSVGNRSGTSSSDEMAESSGTSGCHGGSGSGGGGSDGTGGRGHGHVGTQLASSRTKKKKLSTARDRKDAARGGGPGKKKTIEAAAMAIVKDEQFFKKDKRLKEIQLELQLSNKIARRRLNEQTKATNVMTISQAYNVCQSSGDENGAREMHHLMLTMARAAARSHIGDQVEVDLE
jgi:hypothetical protein